MAERIDAVQVVIEMGCENLLNALARLFAIDFGAITGRENDLRKGWLLSPALCTSRNLLADSKLLSVVANTQYADHAIVYTLF